MSPLLLLCMTCNHPGLETDHLSVWEVSMYNMLLNLCQIIIIHHSLSPNAASALMHTFTRISCDNAHFSLSNYPTSVFQALWLSDLVGLQSEIIFKDELKWCPSEDPDA